MRSHYQCMVVLTSALGLQYVSIKLLMTYLCVLSSF